MKVWLLNIIPASCALIAAAEAGHTHSSLLRWAMVFFLASGIIQAFFVQRWPTWISLQWVARRIAKGERIQVEVEGK